MRILNLILAEASLILAINVAENSPLAIFIPTKLLYLLLVLPIAFMLLKRNPFDVPILILALSLVTVKLLTNSEAFYSLLDALYYLGYTSISEYLNSVFSAYKGSCLIQLTGIVVMFTIAQISWRIEERLKELGIDMKYPLATLGAVGTVIFLLFPTLAELRFEGLPLIFLGLMGLCLTLLAIYVLAT